MSSEGPRSERAGSVASSHTEAGVHDEDFNEKQAFLRDDESLRSPTLYQDSHHEGENDQEDEELLASQTEKKAPEPAKTSAASGVIWIVVNTLATVGIVSQLGHVPCMAHFFLTGEQTGLHQ